MRFRPLLAAIATSMLLAACGGSSQSSTTAATATPAAAQTTNSTQTAATGAGATATSAGATATSAGATATEATATSTASASAPPEVPNSRKHGHHGSSRAASQGAHVETSVTVSAAGDVSPPVVSVPSGVGVEVHVTNRSSAVATVRLAVPAHPGARIAPGTTGTLESAGLKDGTYRILVNGTPRGQLMIGAQGGP